MTRIKRFRNSNVKGALSGLRQFLATESILKIMKNAFRFYQTMKLGQLIEYSMRNIILGKSYTKCVEETILRPFSKKSKLSMSLEQ